MVGGFGRQDLLRFVDLGSVQRLEARDFVIRKVGKQSKKAPNVSVFSVPPELPVIVGR